MGMVGVQERGAERKLLALRQEGRVGLSARHIRKFMRATARRVADGRAQVLEKMFKNAVSAS
ncbi:hypothetical protein CLH39_08445 [Alcaligenes faecalis]|jgi:hypothetical protein|nr:hypothetical protein ASL22_01960 [Alcaligenes faecalis]QRF90253.1 hypothetical protein CLH39_08445 [Alcaligenes faecalis]HBJ68822.1 hypothetical protein [Alcaligenes faecalis]